MPKYLAPGVYVEEVPFGAKAIEGVSTSTTDLVGQETVARLRHFAEAEHQPWREREGHDPGVALLELFAWLTETLTQRMGEVPDAALPHAARIAAASLALIADRTAPSDSVLQQTRFLPGHHLDQHGGVSDGAYVSPAAADRSRTRIRSPHGPE